MNTEMIRRTIQSARYANRMAIQAAQEGRGGHAHDWRLWRERSMAEARQIAAQAR